MPKLKIIRASAGSGKTHFLTGEFLRILITEPTDYFRSMLAVTFTNRATREMKSRIIVQLYNLAKDKNSDYIEKLTDSSGFDEKLIRNKASAILKNILHDYSWFAVETIDSFFQRIIRAFARELAIPGRYNIEIDTSPILEYAVDSLIDGIGPGSDLMKWLTDYTEQRIIEGKPWDIKRDLIHLGEQVFKEDFSKVALDVFEIISDKEITSGFLKKLYSIKSGIEQKFGDFGIRGVELIEKLGLKDEDFFQAGKGTYAFFRKLADKQVVQPNNYVLKLLTGAETLPSGRTKRKEDVVDAGEKLIPILRETLTSLDENYFIYNTAHEILKNFYALGILADLSHRISQYRIEKNCFILSDAPVFIYKIIENNDSPFIYEKIGNRFKHYMIDEFQDTSVLQWNNFRPLINNSLSNGHDCLLVGDVKQSIYRWRNSNWEVLSHQIRQQFPEEIMHEENLPVNWRSCDEIIKLNNLLFPAASEVLEESYRDKLAAGSYTLHDDMTAISEIYSDTMQGIPGSSKGKGFVRLQFFSVKEASDNSEYINGPLIENLNHLLEHGYLPSEIAVIVRNKKEGQVLANLLIEKNAEKGFIQNLGTISEESLFLDASDAVNMIIAALRYISNPEDSINRAKFSTLFESARMEPIAKGQVYTFNYRTGSSKPEMLNAAIPAEIIENLESLGSLPLYDLAENLIRVLRADLVQTDLPYIHALLDLVFEYIQTNPEDISRFLEFWEEEGSRRSIPASEVQNAVRIITIHKSKGLEYRAVIIPFCNWSLNQKSDTILWATPRSEVFRYFPIFPLNYVKGLQSTEFADLYYEELYRSYVDNLNILYVAFTRAVESLIVFPVYKEDQAGDSAISTVGDLLFSTMLSRFRDNFKQNFSKDEKTYLCGELKKPVDKDSPVQSDLENIQSYKTGKAIDRLYFRGDAYDYLAGEEEGYINAGTHGRALHNILAGIKTLGDIERIINKSVFEGLICEEEGIELKSHIEKLLSDPLVRSWFDGSGQVMTEADILLSEGRTRRPDRVVLFNERIEVVDYKFGSDKHLKNHQKQVKEYTDLIINMENKDVRGYIWYVNLNRVETL